MSFLKDNLVMLFASGIGFFLAYLFQVLSARLLSPSDFGNLGVCIGLVTILSVFVGGLKTLTVKRVSEFSAQKKEDMIGRFIGRLSRRVFFGSLLFSLLLFLLSDLLASSIFGDPSLSAPFKVLAIVPLFANLVPVAQGFLAGKKKFVRLAVNIDSAGSAKVAAGIGLVYLGFGVPGALFGIILSSVVVILLVPEVLKFLLSDSGDFKLRSDGAVQFIVLVSLSSLLISFMNYNDLFFVKSSLSPEDAGIYNVGSLIARLLYFVSGVVVSVSFPEFARARVVGKKKVRASVLKAMKMYSLFCLPALFFFHLLPGPFISFFFSDAYVNGAPVLFNLSFAYLFLGFGFILLNSCWALGETIKPLMILAVCAGIHFMLLSSLISSGISGAFLSTTLSMFLFLSSINFLSYRLLSS